MRGPRPSSSATAGTGTDEKAARPPRPARRVLRAPAPAPGSDRDVRLFGLVLLVGCGIAGSLLRWYFGHPTASAIVWGAGAAVGLFALLAPRAARPVYRAWMAFGHVLGRVNTTILLSVVHLVLFTGTGLILRLLGRDALSLRLDREAESYWVPKNLPRDPARYFDPF